VQSRTTTPCIESPKTESKPEDDALSAWPDRPRFLENSQVGRRWKGTGGFTDRRANPSSTGKHAPARTEGFHPIPLHSTPNARPPVMPSPEPSSPLALLCIDVQPMFLKSLPEGGAPLLRRCQFAVAAAAGLGVPVVFTEQVPQKLGPTAAELLACTPAGALQLGKSTFSAFADDGIRDALGALSVEHLLICGLETSVCVYQTALDALASSYQVTLLSDAVGCRRPEDASPCLQALIRAGAHVLPSETVFYALLHSTSHPFFKSYTQLVKSHA
jgi:nicotinamidase-related amidase